MLTSIIVTILLTIAVSLLAIIASVLVHERGTTEAEAMAVLREVRRLHALEQEQAQSEHIKALKAMG